MRTGVRLGIDVGAARIGVSRSDLHGMLATPLETVQRLPEHDALSRLGELISEHEAIECVVGLPINLRGERTASTEHAEAFARALARATPCPVRLVDERLSTKTAQTQLHQTGKNTRNSRQIIDQQAAVIILQHALDIERSLSAAPGSLVSPDESTT